MNDRPVTFTLGELWLLSAFVRADCPERERWAWPPANKALNDEIAFAIVACEEDRLSEYTLELSEGDLIVIDNVVKFDAKTTDARGKDILLKTYKARAQLAGLTASQNGSDYRYAEVHHANGEETELG